MPDTVIITLLWNGQEMDMELPAKVPLKGFMDSLKQILNICFSGISTAGKRLRLKTGEAFLSDDDTLEDYSIFDGGILEIELTV